PGSCAKRMAALRHFTSGRRVCQSSAAREEEGGLCAVVIENFKDILGVVAMGSLIERQDHLFGPQLQRPRTSRIVAVFRGLVDRPFRGNDRHNPRKKAIFLVKTAMRRMCGTTEEKNNR